MQRLALPRFRGTVLLACLLFLSSTPATPAAEKPSETESPSKPGTEQTSEAQQVLRSYLQLQEQLHAAQLAIDRAREDTEAAAKRNAETVAARLKLIEQAISLQRERDMESIQSSNRLVLITAGVLASVGFVALLLTSLFQLRAMNRLAEIASSFPAAHALGHGPAAVLGTTDTHPPSLNTAEQASDRLLGVIARLEKRVLELEHTAHPSPMPGEPAHHNDLSKAADAAAPSEVSPLIAVHDPLAEKHGRIQLALGKGQALLNLDQVENALACFEEVIALDPDNAEALVKKGTALERLKRLEEAIECYDRAIAANRSMTLAYLYKGGVYNQMERFNEALECYEQALRTQEKAPAS